MRLWQKVGLGLILGVICGIYYPEYVSYLKPAGDIFLKLIKMVIPLVIFFSLISGITSVKEPAALSRLGMKSTMIFLLTTIFAVIFGLGFGVIFKPGAGLEMNLDHLALSAIPPDDVQFSLLNFLLDIVPSNPVKPIVDGHVLQIVFLAIFTGVAINTLKDTANNLKQLCETINSLVMKMIEMVIALSPYASFALTAWIVGTQGIDILMALSKLVIVVIAAMVCQYLIFGLMILVFCRLSPLPFYKKSLEYQVIAFATSSSKATLATTMKICRERLGVSKVCTSFTLPLGAAINMNGLAINLGLAVIFFAQLIGVELNLYQYFILVITITLGSIGGAGIPGASVIMLPMVLSSVGLPIEGVMLVTGIDRILDMLRTVISITGDVATTIVIDHSEGTLDRAKYYAD